MDPNQKGYQRHRSFGSAGDSNGHCRHPLEIEENKRKKKLLHRDIERQRRQEMATLFASLRSHLPLQYIKGKRATSEHINGAVSFIKDTERRITELSSRKDELSRDMGQNYKPKPDPEKTEPASDPVCVMVQPCVSGFEVVLSSNSSGPHAFPLSRVLEALQEQGLEVMSSLTTRVNERLMHTIQVEVDSFGCFDLAWLQQKLVDELTHSAG